MSRFKVMSLCVITAMCMAIGGLVLTGCSSAEDDEAAIKEALTEQFDQLKSLDDATVDEIAQAIGSSELSNLGIAPADFAKAYLDGFDYSVQDVKADGDSATATVTVTCKSLKEFESSLNTMAEEYIKDESNWEKSETQIYQEIGTKVMESLKSVPTATTSPIKLSFAKSNGEWSSDSSNESAITNAMLAL